MLSLNFKEVEKINDESIVEILAQSRKIIKKYFTNKLFLETDQIPRGGKEYLNCDRAFDIFANHKVMPEYCFSCYKVQISPKNVIDLIKLFFLFDIMYFEKENLRKSFIDFREDEKNYKGIIYCTTLEEAKKINNNIGKYLKISIDEKIKSYNFLKSQVRGHRSPEMLRLMARFRGIQGDMENSEAFQIIRWIE